MFRLLACALSLAAGPVGGAWAHEFWIAPETYTLADGQEIVVSLRTGPKFEGTDLAYMPKSFTRFDLIEGEKDTEIEGAAGAIPAARVPAGDGLAIVAHETAASTVRWTDWGRFQTYCNDKDFGWAIGDHADRALPETGFDEQVVRYAKALVSVGSGQGMDRPVGLETEFVALTNPYLDDLSKGVKVQLLYHGKPRMNAQVEVFTRGPDGAVADDLLRTDTEGKVQFAVTPRTEYMLDAVVMRPASGSVAQGTPVWESLWASLTFRTPG